MRTKLLVHSRTDYQRGTVTTMNVISKELVDMETAFTEYMALDIIIFLSLPNRDIQVSCPKALVAEAARNGSARNGDILLELREDPRSGFYAELSRLDGTTKIGIAMWSIVDCSNLLLSRSDMCMVDEEYQKELIRDSIQSEIECTWGEIDFTAPRAADLLTELVEEAAGNIQGGASEYSTIQYVLDSHSDDIEGLTFDFDFAPDMDIIVRLKNEQVLSGVVSNVYGTAVQITSCDGTTTTIAFDEIEEAEVNDGRDYD